MAIARWRPFVSVERWDPFRNMTDIQGEVNRLFDSFLGRPTASTTGSAVRTWAPVLDMHETKDDLVLNFELPGVAEKDVSLSITGDLLTGREAHDWGLAIEAPPAGELDARFEALLERIALMPVNQLVMMKLLVNQTLYSQGLHATQVLGTVFDGVARHTPEGYAFQRRAAEAGWQEAVRERDEPFG